MHARDAGQLATNERKNLNRGMKNESLMRRNVTPPIIPWSVEAGEAPAGSALAEPKCPSTDAPKAGTRGETKPTGRFAAWFHAPFIP